MKLSQHVVVLRGQFFVETVYIFLSPFCKSFDAVCTLDGYIAGTIASAYVSTRTLAAWDAIKSLFLTCVLTMERVLCICSGCGNSQLSHVMVSYLKVKYFSTSRCHRFN